jgi:hypothetical protein
MSTTGTAGNFAPSQNYTTEQSQNWTDRCCDEVSRAVDENPAGSLLTAFGAGLGIGVALGLSVAFSSARPKPRSRAEELSQRILEAVQDFVPDSISRRLS